MDFSKIYRALMLMNDNLRLSKPLLNRNLVFKVFKRNKNIGWNTKKLKSKWLNNNPSPRFTGTIRKEFCIFGCFTKIFEVKGQ